MTTLIIPAAGRSTRYGLSRPKFLLQHPKGKTMIAAGVEGLSKANFTRAVVVSLAEYFEDIDPVSISSEISQTMNCDVSMHLLDTPTASMVDTINEGIEFLGDDQPIVIKDTDNQVIPGDFSQFGQNFIVYADLQIFRNVVAANKSFIEKDSYDFLTNIVEKRIVGSAINTGLVGFERASDFLRASMNIASAGEKYVSDVIRFLLDRSQVFSAVSAEEYLDWGTLTEWREYCKQFATIFVDIDGVLAVNENPNGKNGKNWNRFRPIEENIEPLVAGSISGKYKIVFTTSRSAEFRSLLITQLEELGFVDFEVVMGLPHAQRILINDFAPTNPFPSATAINLVRNSANLGDYLR